jgi:hypothetical protein
MKVILERKNKEKKLFLNNAVYINFDLKKRNPSFLL